jgi:hypothetical protein
VGIWLFIVDCLTHVHKRVNVHYAHKALSKTFANLNSVIPSPSDDDLKEEIKSILSAVIRNSGAQGHICINNSDLFEISLNNRVYGFPGKGNTSLSNLEVTGWRSISSLYNIGLDDIVLLYRKMTSGGAAGDQEFHGIFRVAKKGNTPLLLLHCNDEEYLPMMPGENQYLPFRFMFEQLTDSPFSIPNDLRNKTYRKNNNLEIIKAFSEIDPKKPKLWGFRHPAVMNIGAARKSSIKCISHNQLIFLLELLLSTGVRRPVTPLLANKRYDPNRLPEDCVLLDDNFLEARLVEHARSARNFKNEAELYSYVIGSFKNPYSIFHKKIVEDFAEINTDVPFGRINENVLLEVVITPHIQEEIDILLCDSDEQNFLILEVKNDELNAEDIEQAEKYIQLVDQRFPGSQSISANVIGIRNSGLRSTERVKLVSYEIEEIDGKASVSFRLN